MERREKRRCKLSHIAQTISEKTDFLEGSILWPHRCCILCTSRRLCHTVIAPSKPIRAFYRGINKTLFRALSLLLSLLCIQYHLIHLTSFKLTNSFAHSLLPYRPLSIATDTEVRKHMLFPPRLKNGQIGLFLHFAQATSNNRIVIQTLHGLLNHQR